LQLLEGGLHIGGCDFDSGADTNRRSVVGIDWISQVRRKIRSRGGSFASSTLVYDVRKVNKPPTPNWRKLNDLRRIVLILYDRNIS
jgi:hypothetical protein